MMQPPDIAFHKPVLLKNWVISVSKDKKTGNLCMVMFHRTEHTTSVRYARNIEELNDFANCAMKQ